MTEAPIYMTNSYCGLSSLIYRLKYDKVMEKERMEILLTAIITTVDTLSSNLTYRKMKNEIDPFDASGLNEYIDQTMNTNLLEIFFGENELSEMERQLKRLKDRLIDTTTAFSFDWQRFFE